VILFGALCMLAPLFEIPSAGATPASGSVHIAANAKGLAAIAVSPKISQFCSYADNVSKTGTSPSESDEKSALEADYAKLKSEEPAIINASPSQIKGDFQTLFSYINKLYSELASVDYNFVKLPHSYYTSLESSAAPVAKAAKAIETYLVKSCGLKIPKV
jgi:hypothetical protein